MSAHKANQWWGKHSPVGLHCSRELCPKAAVRLGLQHEYLMNRQKRSTSWWGTSYKAEAQRGYETMPLLLPGAGVDTAAWRALRIATTFPVSKSFLLRPIESERWTDIVGSCRRRRAYTTHMEHMHASFIRQQSCYSVRPTPTGVAWCKMLDILKAISRSPRLSALESTSLVTSWPSSLTKPSNFSLSAFSSPLHQSTPHTSISDVSRRGRAKTNWQNQ